MNNKWYRGIHALNGAIFAIKSLFCPLSTPRLVPARARAEWIPISLNTYMKSERKKISQKRVSIHSSSLLCSLHIRHRTRRWKKSGCRTYKQEQQRNTNRCSNYWFISHSFWIFLFFPRELVQLKPRIFIDGELKGRFANSGSGQLQRRQLLITSLNLAEFKRDVIEETGFWANIVTLHISLAIES